MADLGPEIRRYLADSYPHNHGYRVVRGRLRPNRQLRRRWRRLRRLWPDPLESLLDVGCSKGWFVLQAAARPTCRVALGIDVTNRDVAVSETVRRHLGLERARFERVPLHEVAERPAAFGGPFQTVMLVNGYQYLFFGSRLSPHCYETHAEIFRHLSALCRERLVFSNRLALDRLPRNVQARARDAGRGEAYTREAILAAASEHFVVRPAGRLGRIPLLCLSRRTT